MDCPKTSCVVCGKNVYTCELPAFDGGCSNTAHHGGCQLEGGAWVCSSECWDAAAADDLYLPTVRLRALRLVPGSLLLVRLPAGGDREATWRRGDRLAEQLAELLRQMGLDRVAVVVAEDIEVDRVEDRASFVTHLDRLSREIERLRQELHRRD